MKYDLHFLLLVSVLLCGCATTRPPSLDTAAVKAEQHHQARQEVSQWLHHQQRLDHISYPISRNASPLCGESITAATGLRLSSPALFPKRLRKAARQQLGDTEHLQVLWLMPDSPAANSPLQIGDRLLRVNGRTLAPGRKGVRSYKKLLRQAARQTAPLELEVVRNEEHLNVSLIPETLCRYPIAIRLEAVPNAVANGSRITLYSGLLDLFPNDRDVAFVISHELAHNILRHPYKGIASGPLRVAADFLLGVTGLAKLTGWKFTPAFEVEADYVGLYITALAGYDIQGAETIWRHFAAATSRGKERTLTNSHPPTPERYVALKQTIEEIQRKQAEGLPLRPNGL